MVAISFPAVTAVIVSGATATGPIDARSGNAFGLMTPSVFTGTAIQYAVSDDGLTWVPLCDATGAIVIQQVVASRAYAVPAGVAGYPWFEVVSTAAQGGDRPIRVVAKG